MSVSYVIIFESASAIVRVFPDKTAMVANVISGIPREGHGSGLMRAVTSFADDNGLMLYLSVQAYGTTSGLTNQQLLLWYTKYGFERDPEYTKPPWRMIRKIYTGPNEKSDRPSDPLSRLHHNRYDFS